MTTAAALTKRHPALVHTGTAKMHLPTLQKAGEILDDLKRDRGKTLNHVWGYDPNTRNTEHHSGRALDFMVHNDRAAGDHIANYVINNQTRLGLVHIIWRQRIYRGPRSTSTNPKGVWQNMADRGNPTQNHMDHPHVLFAATAHVPLTPAVEPTTLSSLLVRGSTGPEVTLLQKMLNGMDRAGLSLDGKFGPATDTAVRAAQSKRKLEVDGKVGPATRTALNAAWKAHNTPTTTTTTTRSTTTTTTTKPVTTTTTTKPVTTTTTTRAVTTTTTTAPALEVVRGVVRQELSLALLGALDNLKEKP